MFARNPAFLGQVRLMSSTFDPLARLGQGADTIDNVYARLVRAMESGNKRAENYWARLLDELLEDWRRRNPGKPDPKPLPVPPDGYEYDYPDVGLPQLIPSSPVPGVPQFKSQTEYPPPPIEDIGPEPPPVETPLPPIEDIGPESSPVESRDDFYSYRTEQTPPLPGAEAAQGLPCPPGQYRPPGAGWCVPKPVATSYGGGGFGGFGGYGGIINMGPSGGVPFTMGRAMLGQVRLVRRPY